ncbi:hypothetical protein DSO57_1028401 [Entomophthora muscae]|uniref:Uncharacterized protein n=1 Tax=Entomophthora muscae TaxID=34485 RepID=A0ACC2SQS8_9FUNG|nr:hypothetical protein DSO57_1028401 [Entomophthora muscae]
MEIFRSTLASFDILARTVIMPEGDAKANIVKVAHSINAELLIMSPNIVTPFQRAVHGSLEEHLLRHGDFTVVIAKPKTKCISPKIRRDSGLGVSASASPTEIPTLHVPTLTPPKPTPAQKSFPHEVPSPTPPSSELQSETDSAQESDDESDVLTNFREQLDVYHSKATLDASEVWGLSDDEISTKPEKSAEHEPHLEVSFSNSRGFRPRAPQPRVKSIIETLPNP